MVMTVIEILKAKRREISAREQEGISVDHEWFYHSRQCLTNSYYCPCRSLPKKLFPGNAVGDKVTASDNNWVTSPLRLTLWILRSNLTILKRRQT